jgi:hypothetical protein
MIRSNSIFINAPLADVFSVASDLVRWPEYLSHYRYNKFLSPMPWGGIVKMAAKRTGIPLAWISIYRIDTDSRQLYFEHLSSFLDATRGMKVVWHFREKPGGTEVEITHEHTLAWPIIGGFVANVIVGWFFIHHVAGKTLAGIKKKVEKRS